MGAAIAVFIFSTKSLMELGVEFSSRNQGPLMVTLSFILIVLVLAFFSRGLLSYFFFFRGNSYPNLCPYFRVRLPTRTNDCSNYNNILHYSRVITPSSWNHTTDHDIGLN